MDYHSQRIRECFKSEKCLIPSKCYRYLISYTDMGRPRLETMVDWACVDATKERRTSDEDVNRQRRRH